MRVMIKEGEIPETTARNVATYSYGYADHLPVHIEEMCIRGWRLMAPPVIGHHDDVITLVWERDATDADTEPTG
jgi:hypothetical protein